MKSLHLLVAPLLCSLALSLLAGCGRRTGAGHLEQGLAHLRAGSYKAAVRSLKRASSRITDSAPLYYNLGSAYFAMGNMDGAAEAFEAALKIAPADPLAQEYLAQVHLQRQSWEPARDLLARALPRAAKDDLPRLLNALALAEQHLGRDDIACLRLLQAQRADRRHAPTLYNLASFYRDRLQLYEEAVDHFELFVRLAPPADPHVAKARDAIRRLKAANTRGEGAKPRGQPPRRDASAAERAFREGENQLATKRWERAATAYNRALAANPAHYEAAFNLGRALSSAGRREEAIKAFQQAGDIEPGRVEPLYWQALEAYNGRDYALAAQLLAAHVIPRWPNHAPGFYLMALVRYAQNRGAEARLYGEYYLELTPGGAQRREVVDWVRSLPQ